MVYAISVVKYIASFATEVVDFSPEDEDSALCR
jgi:hypothetical protein